MEEPKSLASRRMQLEVPQITAKRKKKKGRGQKTLPNKGSIRKKDRPAPTAGTTPIDGAGRKRPNRKVTNRRTRKKNTAPTALVGLDQLQGDKASVVPIRGSWARATRPDHSMEGQDDGYIALDIDEDDDGSTSSPNETSEISATSSVEDAIYDAIVYGHRPWSDPKETQASRPMTRLSSLEIELQERYNFEKYAETSFTVMHGPDREIDNDSILCLVCGDTGHPEQSCSKLTCKLCGQVETHFARQCPTARKCRKCGEPGHEKDNCPYKLARSSDEIRCDICDKKGHDDSYCPIFWVIPPPIQSTFQKLQRLTVSCGLCASKTHYLGDCSLRDKKQPVGSAATTFSTENARRYLDSSSAFNAELGSTSGLPSGRLPPPRQATQHRRFGPKDHGPPVPEVDNDDADDADFFGPRVPKNQSGSRNINFGGRQLGRRPPPRSSFPPARQQDQTYRDRTGPYQSQEQQHGRARSSSPRQRHNAPRGRARGNRGGSGSNRSGGRGAAQSHSSGARRHPLPQRPRK
ncbi:MAG: hypothetical protein M1825_006211 [Sarcosagium campestre]|nr:MAG: hypothetical protein M1825_006211 [Sarcosagium campestre]